MKKIFTLSFFVLLIGMTANTGCVKGGGGSNPIVAAIPNIANFELKAASTFVAGAASVVSILSSTLGDGVFNVNFNITGADNLSNQTATLTMSGGSGTFNTPALSAAGECGITINSISNSAGGSANITSNNTYNFSDSEGLMTATYTSGGTGTPLRATHVIAQITGGLLTITGIIWTPNLTTINLYDDIYSGAASTVYFNSNDFSFSGPNSSSNGSAHYTVAGASVNIADLSEHGMIKISTVSPLLTGTFSYTNQDSSTVVGSFSCQHP